MSTLAEEKTYLRAVKDELAKTWPRNRAIHLVFHGHSVPAGYFKTPVVETFHAYPHLLHLKLKERYPHAVINSIVTAIGGEESERGAARFESEVLCHRPDVLMIDYGLNDRRLGLEKARAAWSQMITTATRRNLKVILLTPTLDNTDLVALRTHAEQVRALAVEHGVGLVDSFALWETAIAKGTPREALLSQSNHPNTAGHTLVADGLLRWFGEPT